MSVERTGFAMLGLGEAERAAYELLVDGSPATADELAAGWTRPEPLIEVLARLAQRSLASTVPGTPPRLRAQSPRVAFDGALAEFEEALEDARRHVAVLETAYRARPTARDSGVVELVAGKRVVGQRLARIRAGARERVDCLFKPPSFPELTESDPPRRGLVCRTVYDRAAVEHLGALATVERRIEEGELARALPDLPVSLCVVDDRMAVLPLHRHPAASDAIMVVHPSALLDAMSTLFDGLWRRALPLHPAAHAVAGPRAGEDPTRLVRLLLSGLTDGSIANQLGISHRTVQRRVSTLMTELGAHTRFQAGVRAALAVTRRES